MEVIYMENLNEMLYKIKSNVKDYIVENHIQEPLQIIKDKQ